MITSTDYRIWYAHNFTLHKTISYDLWYINIPSHYIIIYMSWYKITHNNHNARSSTFLLFSPNMLVNFGIRGSVSHLDFCEKIDEPRPSLKKKLKARCANQKKPKFNLKFFQFQWRNWFRYFYNSQPTNLV